MNSFPKLKLATAGAPAPKPIFGRDALLRRMLAAADFTTALLVGGSLALFIDGATAAWTLLIAPVWVLLAKLHGLYDADQRSLRHLTIDEVPRISAWAVTVAVVVLGWSNLAPGHSLTLRDAALCWALAVAWATALRAFGRRLWRRVAPPERALVVGDGPSADSFARKLVLFPDIHAQVVGRMTRLSVAEVETSTGLLAEVDRIVLASEAVTAPLVHALVLACRRERAKLSVVPPLGTTFGTVVQVDQVADLPMLEYNTWDVSRSTLALKRATDVAVSVVALAVLWPLFLAIALAVKLDSPGPVLFRQQRASIHGRPFWMLKFRTMVSNAEELLPELVVFDELDDPVFKLENDPRTTHVGRVLRRFSLDELPQLINILRGDMSIVGPRPEQVDLVERYGPEDRFRLDVKPGLTGPMQVFGRGHLTFAERRAVEREYVENLSLRRDLRIVALTITTVVTGKGAF